MKNKYFNYILMGLGIACLITLFIGRNKFSSEMDLVLSIAFSCLFSIGYVGRTHNKLLNHDKSYSTETKDERNVLIKIKTGNMTNIINLFLLGIVAVTFIYLEYYVPATIVFVLIVLQPILMIMISNYYAKKI